MAGPSARRFHFLKEIASGGFGSVYVAKVMEADGFSRLMAVKLLHSRWSDNVEIGRRMKDEARLLGCIRHRNIVNVHGFTTIGGRVAVMMEYLEAVDLKVITNALAPAASSDGETMILRPDADVPRVPVRAALEIVASVASALDAAYNLPPFPGDKPLRVIHRDIKPSNIMLDESGVVKVLDFGVARAEFDHRESHTQELQFGSVDYMPPERLFFEPETDLSDVYSLGTTLYELLALEKLGKAKSRADRHAQFLDDRMDVLRGRGDLDDLNGEAVIALLRSMCAHSAEKRPPAAEVMTRCRALARACSGVGLQEWAETIVPSLVLQARNAMRDPNPLTDAVLIEDTGGFRGDDSFAEPYPSAGVVVADSDSAAFPRFGTSKAAAPPPIPQASPAPPPAAAPAQPPPVTEPPRPAAPSGGPHPSHQAATGRQWYGAPDADVEVIDAGIPDDATLRSLDVALLRGVEDPFLDSPTQVLSLHEDTLPGRQADPRDAAANLYAQAPAPDERYSNPFDDDEPTRMEPPPTPPPSDDEETIGPDQRAPAHSAPPAFEPPTVVSPAATAASPGVLPAAAADTVRLPAAAVGPAGAPPPWTPPVRTAQPPAAPVSATVAPAPAPAPLVPPAASRSRTGLWVAGAAAFLLVALSVAGGAAWFLMNQSASGDPASASGAATPSTTTAGAEATAANASAPGPDRAAEGSAAPGLDRAAEGSAAPDAIRFASAAPDTARMSVTCDGRKADGTVEVAAAGPTATRCTVMVIQKDRTRLSAEVADASTGLYTCFAGPDRACTRAP